MSESDKKLTRADLSKDQAEVYDAIVRWTKGGSIAPSGKAPKRRPDPRQLGFNFDKPVGSSLILTVGGFAGTGKSSMLGVFAKETKLLVAYITYTGRASSVLRRKLKASGAVTTTKTRPPGDEWDERWHDPSLPMYGGPSFVGTIHRLLYAPIINKREELLGWRKREEFDRRYALIVCDEASMIGDEMLEDIEAHGVPILAVGDHGQLPPVMASGELMKNPDLRLEKIHRQAEKNPIIALSKRVRETGELDDEHADGKHIRFRSRKDIDRVLRRAYKKLPALEVGLLCWTNRKRIQLNGAARGALKLKGAPRKSEIVLCLKNNAPVYNGMRGVLTSNGVVDKKEPWILHATVAFPDEQLEAHAVDMCAATFNREHVFRTLDEIRALGIPAEKFSDAGHPYDFGYAMTVHKMQGSSVTHAIFYLDRRQEPDSEDWRRFAYTAVTRASERLTVLT